jgi:hypothetical protein
MQGRISMPRAKRTGCMTDWEQRIVAAFVKHYFAASPKTGEEKRAVLRLRHATFFRGFDAAPPDEKESYLEAAEALERKGLVKINWEKRGEGERIKTISCADFEKLFDQAGGAYPQAEAEKIRALFKDCAQKFHAGMTHNEQKTHIFLDCMRRVHTPPLWGVKKGMYPETNTLPKQPDPVRSAAGLVDYLAGNFSPREISQGIDQKAADDFMLLLEMFLNPAKLKTITTRALSILLYKDSKRLENILALFNSLLSRAQKEIPVPSLTFLERSFPDAFIAGNIIFEYKQRDKPPLVNALGLILGLPLESVNAIGAIKTIAAKENPSVLIIENKETFYALGGGQKFNSAQPYDCFLLSSGYRSQAAAALIRLLAASDFCLYHAGDLDPDGILILQNIRDTAERAVTPVMMNAAVFDRYISWARPLGKGALRQLKKIRADTRAIPGIAELIQRIEETARGVEQEIIDYRIKEA